jgi:hypothetical protein
MNSSDLDQANATVALTLNDGRRFEGNELWLAGGIVSNGSEVAFRYEGAVILEID